MKKRKIPRSQIASIIWARVESKMFCLQPVGVGVEPMASLYCQDGEERVYAIEDLRLGVDCFTSLFILFMF